MLKDRGDECDAVDPANAEGLIGATAAAEMLGLSRRQLQRALDAGLPHYRLTKPGLVLPRLLFDPKVLENAVRIRELYGRSWITVLRVASDLARESS